MVAFLRAYTDSGHTSEVAHSPAVSTTTAGGTQNAGTTTLQVTSTTNMAPQGAIDIDTGPNLESLPYSAIIDSTHLSLAKPTTINHASGVAVVQWYYSLAVGDQVTGILNDGSNASPNGNINVATWYLYNAGDQTAQSIDLATVSGAPSTPLGYTDTLLSITNATSGFATSVTPPDLASGGVRQFWACEEVATGQSPAANPQACALAISYQSV